MSLQASDPDPVAASHAENEIVFSAENELLSSAATLSERLRLKSGVPLLATAARRF